MFTTREAIKRARLPIAESELILAHLLKTSREKIITIPEYKLGFLKYLKFYFLAWKRKKNIPLAYITGKKEFYGFKFKVNKHTLVPRPETETMVEEILRLNQEQKNLIVDVGTGSGAIIISLAKNLPKEHIFIGTDVCQKALDTAIQNAKTHNIDIIFRKGNLLNPVVDEIEKNNYDNLIICANLPYLTAEERKSEPSIKHEPTVALVADNDGLALYEQLLYQITKSNIQKKVFCFCEINPHQKEKLEKIIKGISEKLCIESIKDLSEKTRIVKIGLTP